MRYSFLLFLFLLSFFGFSQNLPFPKNIQSPNASSLGEYGDMPVSYYTGTPQISIPLYDISDKGIPLDITLNYNASGVRVNSVPGWVGQNWSLQAGGVITRTIKGVADEYKLDHSSSLIDIDFYGYLYPESHNLLNNSNWSTPSYVENTLSDYLINHLPDYQSRFEPDIFTFNFMGFTGKFFLGSDGEWKVSSNSNLKIIIEQADLEYPFGESIVPFNYNHSDVAANFPASKMIYKITIIDDLGNKYIFGNTDTSIEYSVPFFSQVFNGYWRGNSWYLTKVLDRFDNEVYEFEYERDNYIASFFKYYSNFNFNAEYSENLFGFDLDCTNSGGSSHNYSGDLISPVYLKKINTLRGDINFNRGTNLNLSYKDDSDLVNDISHDDYFSYSNRYHYYYLLPYSTIDDILNKLSWKKLLNISGLSKSVDFDYNDYPQDPSNGDFGNDERLFLQQVEIDSKNVYSFEYDGIDELPKFLSTKVDHWGYYKYTPWGGNFTSNHYNTRNTNSTYVKKGMLTKLVYPTKGWTEFEWEANKYSSYVSDDKSQLISSGNKLAGGVRIKEIINNDGDGNFTSKEFKYVKGYSANNSSTTSSGILEIKPKYYWQDFTLTSFQDSNYVLHETIFNTNPILPLSNYSGTHIGYSEVVELDSDGAYTIHKFTSNDNPDYRDENFQYNSNNSISPYTNYNDKSFLRGKLKRQLIYNSSNVLKKKIENEYSYSLNNYAKGISLESVGCNPGTGFLKADPYKLYYSDVNLIETKIRSFEGSKIFEDRIFYSYSNLNNGDSFLRRKKKIVQGNGLYCLDCEFLKEEYKYPFDFNDVVNTALTNDRHLPIVETKITLGDTDDKIIENKKMEYDYFNSKLLPKKIKVLRKNDTDFTDLYVVDSYTSKQRLEKMHVPGGRYTVYSYKKKYDIDCHCYRETDFPYFKIEGPNLNLDFLNSKTNELNFTSLDPGEYESIQQEVIDYYTNHRVTSYRYSNYLNTLSSITSPRGLTEYYYYTSDDKLSRIRDNNGFTIKEFKYNFKSE